MKRVGVLIPQNGKFTVVNQEFLFARIPMIGENILIETADANDVLTTWVYKVVDVHFDRNGNVDLFAIKVGTNEDYKHTLDKTIVE